MTRYALYKMCWGEDFIEHSIRSILPYFDKIFVFWDDQPFKAVTECEYRGRMIQLPRPVDRAAGKVVALSAEFPQITLIYDKTTTTWNLFQHLVNKWILPNYPAPDCAILMASDYVWHPEQLERALALFGNETLCANSKMVEIWRGFEHYADRRSPRVSCPFWNLKLLGGPMEKNPLSSWGEVKGIPILDATMHNLGYACSPHVAFWKHLSTLAFAKAMGDSLPGELWFENVWLPWDYETCNTNLEIAAKWTHFIPSAEPYDTAKLPPLILSDLENLKRQTSNATWKVVP